ncbi:MAG: cysteine hydrolase family protein [Planctomycetota bacterium]|jgi:nicotinamidase-related amidase
MGKPFRWTLILVVAVVAPASTGAAAAELSLRTRDPESGKIVTSTEELDPSKTAVVVIDMWDDHWCKTLARRTAELVPHMNLSLDAFRALGVPIVFAPSGVLEPYRDHPARKAMLAIPAHPMPDANGSDPPRPPWNRTGGCECGPDRPCKSRKAWSRQHADLVIRDGDFLGNCNDSRELASFCQERGVTQLIYMGVHTNMCVCYRGFGMVSMKRLGFRPILVRDLTDAAAGNGFDPDLGKPDPRLTLGVGTDRVVAHIETHVAPTITSTDLTGRPPFRFPADNRSPEE